MEEMLKYLRALVLLELDQAQARAEREGGNSKLEVLLADAGFSNTEVAQMVGKSVAAAAKAISRARATRRAGSIATVNASQENTNEEP